MNFRDPRLPEVHPEVLAVQRREDQTVVLSLHVLLVDRAAKLCAEHGLTPDEFVAAALNAAMDGVALDLGKAKEEARESRRAAAMKLPGDVRKHFKGGVYRVLGREGDETFYQHLAPEVPGIFKRDPKEFEGEIPWERGGGPRFAKRAGGIDPTGKARKA